jgi:hypothetical protein
MGDKRTAPGGSPLQVEPCGKPKPKPKPKPIGFQYPENRQTVGFFKYWIGRDLFHSVSQNSDTNFYFCSLKDTRDIAKTRLFFKTLLILMTFWDPDSDFDRKPTFCRKKRPDPDKRQKVNPTGLYK